MAQAEGELQGSRRVDDIVRASRCSHRAFIALFMQATGLSPKRYARLMRLQRLLALLRSPSLVSLAESALAAGYAGFDVSTFADCGVAAQGSSWYVTFPRLSVHLLTAAAQGIAATSSSAASSASRFDAAALPDGPEIARLPCVWARSTNRLRPALCSTYARGVDV